MFSLLTVSAPPVLRSRVRPACPPASSAEAPKAHVDQRRVAAQLTVMPVSNAPTSFEDIVYPAATFGVICFGIFLLGLVLPIFQELTRVNRFFAACCLAALVNASTVSAVFLHISNARACPSEDIASSRTTPTDIDRFPHRQASVSSLVELYTGPEAATADCGPNGFVHAPAPAPALYACWLTLGYFVQDCISMALFPSEMKEGNGGSTAYMIMWLHHIGSLITWPWGMLSDTYAPFITYCLATEVTNIGQNLFMLANRGKVSFLCAVEMPIGIAWLLGFFVVRILPVPYILYAYVNTLVLGGGCGISNAEWIAGLIMTPIPVCLNIFWFQKIVKKAMRMLSKKQN